MLIILALALLGPGLDDPADPTPLITGIFPPGVTTGTRQSWTISGRDLDRARVVVASGSGLTFGPLTRGAGGRSLLVEVAAADTALVGFHEVRVDGPGGMSNLALARVDHLRQVVESEPNDQAPALGQVIAVGTAVAGTIRALDVDRFRIEGKPGQLVTLDWETRRLGTAIIPVLTVTGPNRSAIGQARTAPGGDRDCRFPVVVPPEGWFEVELRDNTYGGDDRSRYRLRVDPAPCAAGVFPLGGPPSARLDLVLSGGSLPGPVASVTQLPALAESWFPLEPASFGSPRSPLSPSVRLRVGDLDHPEVSEPTDALAGPPEPVVVGANGITINGRIDSPGQVDRFRVKVQAGERFRARVEAAAAGSALDAVLTILGPRGEVWGENDDRNPPSRLEPPVTIDGSPSSDPEVDVVIPSAGLLTVELADRFGSGGPGHGYRLELGPPRVDFAVHLLPTPNSADPGPEARSLAFAETATAPGSPRAPGAFGVFNVRAGESVAVPVVIVPRGRPGTIELEAVGLPAGVRSERVAVRLAPAPRSGSKGATGWDAPPETHEIRLRVDPAAAPGAGTFQVVGRTRGRAGSPLQRQADRVVGVDAAGGSTRPVLRRLTSFPIRIMGQP